MPNSFADDNVEMKNCSNFNSYSVSDENYPKFIKHLKERFGKEEVRK